MSDRHSFSLDNLYVGLDNVRCPTIFLSTANNQNMVEKRLTHLKRWFQRDFKFYEDYNKFMEEIISKEYAREAKTNPSDR